MRTVSSTYVSNHKKPVPILLCFRAHPRIVAESITRCASLRHSTAGGYELMSFWSKVHSYRFRMGCGSGVHLDLRLSGIRLKHENGHFLYGAIGVWQRANKLGMVSLESFPHFVLHGVVYDQPDLSTRTSATDILEPSNPCLTSSSWPCTTVRRLRRTTSISPF